ncbi:MAG: hypothetical protein Q4G40_12405 [Brachybacterium sp.]|nr:hypothetical protein [Brachybacterium sp.]
MLFVPLITGMALGSWLTGRLAGRMDADLLVDRTLIFVALVGALNLVLAVVAPSVPWVFIAPALLGVAIGLTFPVLQLALLDLFPERRGSASSMAAFVILAFNALIAGLVAPIVTQSVVTTSMASVALSLIGIGFWLWHRRAHAPGAGDVGGRSLP